MINNTKFIHIDYTNNTLYYNTLYSRTNKLFRHMSLKTRMLLVVLLLLIVGIWSLAARVSSGLQSDLEKIIVDQLSATADYIAADIDTSLKLRLDLLQELAASITADALTDPAKVQSLLQQRHPFPSVFTQGLFVQGLFVVSMDGVT
ncbi:MAG: hypothetical protein ACREX0_08365, partial [Noviherbaspirillum sp.]